MLECLSEYLLCVKKEKVPDDKKLFHPNFNIVFFLTQDDASQENNMQAEVTGKLKQHFNNTLPKQNNTSAGVSVIMVREINILIHWQYILHIFLTVLYEHVWCKNSKPKTRTTSNSSLYWCIMWIVSSLLESNQVYHSDTQEIKMSFQTETLSKCMLKWSLLTIWNLSL